MGEADSRVGSGGGAFRIHIEGDTNGYNRPKQMGCDHTNRKASVHADQYEKKKSPGNGGDDRIQRAG